VIGAALAALAAGPALGAVCEGPIAPETWREELGRLAARAREGEAGLAGALEQQTQRALCVDGPLFKDDLGGLFLTRGLADFESDRRAAIEELSRAAALEIEWDPRLGRGPARDAYRDLARAGVPRSPHTLRDPEGAALLVDGLLSERGPVELGAGRHLVQWSRGGLWEAEWVEVPAGAASGGVVAGPWPVEQREVSLRDTWVSAAGGLVFFRGQINDGARTWEGGGSSPSLSVAGAWSPRTWLALTGDATLGAWAAAERPPMRTGGRFLAGARLAPGVDIQLAAGLRGASLPSPAQGTIGADQPGFGAAWRLGPTGRLRFASPPLGGAEAELLFEADAAWYGPAWEYGGALGLGMNLVDYEPVFRAVAGRIHSQGVGEYVNTYTWYGAELGLRWRLGG